MALFAISDLHLSFHEPKPMGRFGPVWQNHPGKIHRNWHETVTEGDTVLVPGDISWAVRQADADRDLRFVNDLPGRKVILPGNHDFWWTSTSQLNARYDRIFFLKNTHTAYGGIAICGARGWICPGDSRFAAHDEKIYNRELGRLARSLQAAVTAGFDRIVVMMHFPPANDRKEPSGFTALIDAYPVFRVVYGHLHGASSFDAGLAGRRGNAEYTLVSGDFLRFKPRLLIGGSI